jgi:hypothetical protein
MPTKRVAAALTILCPLVRDADCHFAETPISSTMN